MTDEQKQKMAEKYANPLGLTMETDPFVVSKVVPYLRRGFLAGLNARDEEVKILREALEFYAERNHFEWTGDATDLDQPDTVSGEPLNWECGGKEGGDYTLENGGIARQALEHTSKKEG